MAQDYEKFIAKIKGKLGIDLNLYKEAQMKRRITSLRDKKGFNDFLSYFSALEKNKELMDEFTKRLTINVSEFYRNAKRWDVLQEKIIPLLLEKPQKQLTLWSAACSTGEEPYSLAILLNEYFPNVSIKIIATDIDDTVLKQAKQGVYPKQALKNLPDHLKNKYFDFEHNLYHVKSSIKKHIEFRKHNLLADPYPKNIDLLVCRNVLIYFTDEAKSSIYRNFSASLVNKGVLFVGSTEQIFNSDQYNLSLIDTFFYQKG